jgi:hypothetical protein
VTIAKLAAWDGGAEDASGEMPLETAISLDLRSFLSAVADLLHETTHRFEETVARVLELVMTGRGLEERTLVMTLQDFDRLQQEFVALGNVLARYAVVTNDRPVMLDGEVELAQVAGAISVADLRDRLMLRLGCMPADRDVTLQPDEELF